MAAEEGEVGGFECVDPSGVVVFEWADGGFLAAEH